MGSQHSIEIGRLQRADRADWEQLFTDYNAFYRRTLPAEVYERAWSAFADDDRLHALGAWQDGALVGIAHFLVHASTTTADVCYLQDLFTVAQSRGLGVGRALIEHITSWARVRGLARVYWRTQNGNATARRLYDSVATDPGFMIYQIDL